MEQKLKLYSPIVLKNLLPHFQLPLFQRVRFIVNYLTLKMKLKWTTLLFRDGLM